MNGLKHRRTTADDQKVFRSTDQSADEISELQTISELRDYSRVLHKRQPKNHFFKQKIPWRTISLCIIFLIIGSIFLGIGFFKWSQSTISECYEFLLLGSIMFIPGSYHVFILIQVLRGIEDYDYDMLDIMDQD